VKITCVDEGAGALQRGYNVIPSLSTTVCLDPENIDYFLDDVIARDAEDYFIGSMVVYEDGKMT
jgi:hypothetical protein